MMKKNRLVLLVGIVIFLFAKQKSFGDDWLQWRGPNRTDRSLEKGLMQSWPPNGPRQTWIYRRAGSGYSGFAVADGQLFTMGDDGRSIFLICIDVESGDEIWRSIIGEHFENEWGDGPRGTPTVSSSLVFVLTPGGEIACLSRGQGSLIWKKRMQDFGGEIPKWGYAESPLVVDGKLFCTPGGESGAIIALDSHSGSLVWQCKEVTSPAHYSSIIEAEINGNRQLIHLLVDKAVGLNPQNGELIWEAEWSGRTAIIPTAIVKDDLVYVTSGYGIGCSLFQQSDGQYAKQVYRNKVMKNHHGGVIENGGYIYGFSDKVGFVCQEFTTGEKIWNDKKRITKGAVTFADDRYYFVQERDGKVMLLDATPQGLRIEGQFVLSPQTKNRKPKGRIWTHPVVSAGKLFLRDQEIIYCYDIKN